MLRATQSDQALEHQAPRSLGRSADPSDDLDQPYDRIRELHVLAPGETDPGLSLALAPTHADASGVCAMHRLKRALAATNDPTLEDAGALSWIETMERAIANGALDQCSCR